MSKGKPKFSMDEMLAATRAHMLEALAVLVDEGAVHELRIPDAKDRPGSTFTSTYAGYFDRMDKLADCALPFVRETRAEGVYILVNPADPRLLARAKNHLKPKMKNTTSDEQIVSRKWMIIDLDPVRPAGICATDEEQGWALERRDLIHRTLIAEGWPEESFVTMSSGNGGYLLAQTNLVRSDSGLVHWCLQGLAARFDDERVKIDQSMFNPARIIRLPGSRNCKGDDCPEIGRIHRFTQMDIPATPRKPVPQPLLEALALVGQKAKTPKSKPSSGRSTTRKTSKQGAPSGLATREGFKSFVERELSGAELVTDSDAEVEYRLKQCPLTPDHGEGYKPGVRWTPGEGPAFHCFGSRCASLHWSDLREAFEPGYRDRSDGQAKTGERPPHSADQPEYEPGADGQASAGSDGTRLDQDDPSAEEPRNAESEASTGSTGSTGSGSKGSAEWPDPVVPERPKIEVPDFPLETLPPKLKAYALALSTATQTPVILSALLLLGVCSMAVAKKYKLHVNAEHEEHLNLFIMVAMESGELKSPTFRKALAVIWKYQQELTESLGPDIEKAKVLYDTQVQRVEALKSKAAKAKTDADYRRFSSEAASSAESLAGMKRPEVPRLYADDVTPEQLATLLAENDGRLALLSPEGGIFGVLAGRYTQNGLPHFDIILKGYSNENVLIDRRGRKESILEPAITVVMTVQPKVLRDLARIPGAEEKGLTARFLFALPNSALGRRDVNPPPIPQDVREEYEATILRLLKLPLEKDEETDRVTAKPLYLASAAERAYIGFRSKLEPMLAPKGELASTGSWRAKFHGQVARLCGVLHMADWAESGKRAIPAEIPAAVVDRAIEIGRCLVVHAQAAYREMKVSDKASDHSPVVVDDAGYLLEWLIRICKKAGRTVLARNEIQQGTRRRFVNVAELAPALAKLQTNNCIRRITEPAKDKRAKPQEFWAVNPKLLALQPDPTDPTDPVDAGNQQESGPAKTATGSKSDPIDPVDDLRGPEGGLDFGASDDADDWGGIEEEPAVNSGEVAA